MLEEKIRKQVESAGKSLLNELRSISAPKDKGRARMAVDELSDKHLLEIYFWMIAGKTDHWIAKHILKLGYSPDRELTNWRKMVRTFRDRAVPQLQKTVKTPDKKVREVAYQQKARAKKLVENVDALSILHGALVQQKERAELLFSLEREILVPEACDDEAKAEARMLMREAWAEYFGPRAVTDAFDALVRTADKVLDHEYKLGIRDNKPSTWTVEIQHKFHNFLESSITDNGHMLTQGVHVLFGKLEEEAVTLEIKEDGKWELGGKAGEDNK